MFGAIPGKPALGGGPAVDGDYSRHPYHHPAAGWGAAESIASVLAQAGEPIEGFRAIFVMNLLGSLPRGDPNHFRTNATIMRKTYG